MLLGWWNIDDVDWWWKNKEEIKTMPDKEDYNKAQLLNMTEVLADFDVTYLSYTNLAVFTIARVINDMLSTSIFDYKLVFNDKSLDGISISDEICAGGLYSHIDYYLSAEKQNSLYNVDSIRKYVFSVINSNIDIIYNTGIAYKTISAPDLSIYIPRIVVVESCDINGCVYDLLDEVYNMTKCDLQQLVNTFTSNYYSTINAVLGEAINYINQKVSEIKNQQELNSIMPSGPIDLVTRINPEAAVQQPVQQAVPVQPVQQVNPAALSPEEEKAVQMMVNGMFFENMMQNAQQGVPVPQM